MPANTPNIVPCCVTDTGLGRIWWEWRFLMEDCCAGDPRVVAEECVPSEVACR
jgi:hypothetical protein